MQTRKLCSDLIQYIRWAKVGLGFEHVWGGGVHKVKLMLEEKR